MGGIHPESDDFADIRRIRDGRAAQLRDRLDKLRQGEALARTGGSEKTDRERGFDARMRGEPGKKAERRVEPQRVGSVGKVGGKDCLRRNRFGFDYPACRRTGRDGVRLRETGARNNRTESAQSGISHNHILFANAWPWLERAILSPRASVSKLAAGYAAAVEAAIFLRLGRRVSMSGLDRPALRG